MRTEQIIEGHSYTNDPASFCWRTVEVIVEVYGKAIRSVVNACARTDVVGWARLHGGQAWT